MAIALHNFQQATCPGLGLTEALQQIWKVIKPHEIIIMTVTSSDDLINVTRHVMRYKTCHVSHD